jgi:hypothetical protein
MEAFAQQVEQGDAGIVKLDGPSYTVDGEVDGVTHLKCSDRGMVEWNRMQASDAGAAVVE